MTPELEARLQHYNIKYYPGWRVPDAQVYEWLRMGVQDFGCRIFPEAVRILRDYGDLMWEIMHLTPEGSDMRGDPESWLLWEWQVKEVLFPVGYHLGTGFTTAVSSTGKVYGRGYEAHWFFGDSFEDYLLNPRNTWVEVISGPHWTDEMYDDAEQIYKAVYEYDR